MTGLMIRPVAETDDLAALTALLHRAYRPLAEAGMRYVASYQTEEVTRKRLARGRGYIAEWDGRVVGTLTLYPQAAMTECAWYKRDDVWYFGQFAVDPDRQGRGIGAALLDFAEATAREGGARELALDTSERADRLLALYARRGYRPVETVQWPVTNYRSVILSKTL